METQRFYLPALDGVRFLAFLLVFFHHFPRAPWTAAIASFGSVGVDLFLTLSGFLIASLLLHEIDRTGKVSVSRFYVRRVLRIWPLYYLLLFLAFLVAPVLLGQAGTSAHITLLSQHLLPYATLFGNWSYAMFPGALRDDGVSFGLAGPLWTIALEEQFYLVFPLLVAAWPRATLWTVCRVGLAVVLLSVATRLYIVSNGIAFPAIVAFTLAHLDPFAFGIVGAYIWHRHQETLRRLKLYGLEWVALVALIWLVSRIPNSVPSLHSGWKLTAASLGCLLVLYIALRSRWVGAALGCKPIAWLGRISYGLYCFHILAVNLYLAKVSPTLSAALPNGLASPLGFAITLLATVGIAALSYYGFERRFLTLKARYEVVASRPS